jgi:hypothetical protein
MDMTNGTLQGGDSYPIHLAGIKGEQFRVQSSEFRVQSSELRAQNRSERRVQKTRGTRRRQQ